MARNVATTVENNFVLGLITERTELRFPQNAATDIDNCVVDLYGRVTRRPGIDFEDGYVANTIVSTTTSDVFTEYLWEAIGGDSTISFLVQQQGKTIYFFDTSGTLTPSANIASFTIDLSTYVPSSSGEIPSNNPCQYSVGFGKMVIVNRAIQPILVSYNATTQTIEVSEIDIMIRDFKGIDDGLELTERVTATESGLKSSNPEHYYNLINQGWFTGDALAQWDTARTDMPSNADIVGLYRGSATDAFDNTLVSSKSPGYTAAPKGHFILDAFNPDRTQALVDAGYTGVAVESSGTVLDRTLGVNIGDMTNGGGLAAAFDGITTTAETASAYKSSASTTGYVGKNWSGVGGSTVAAMQITIPPNAGAAKRLFRIYAKATAPANSTDGTLLASFTATPSSVSQTFTATTNNTTTSFNYFWVTMSRNDGSSGTYAIAELVIFSTFSTDLPVVYARPTTTCFFNGRAFYAGTDGSDLGSKIFFSRIIENDFHYGQAYSDNDPASESLSDFLPSDGGVISIPEAGLITKLFPTQTSIIVLASNGVWLVSGSGGAPFSASSYQVRKLSSIGSRSPLSVVDYKGTPIWWGEDGIYSVQFNSNYDSFDVSSISEDSIKTFYLDIPSYNRQFVKGVYNDTDDTIFWIFSDNTSLDTTTAYQYNRALCFKPRSKAFYPWTFETSTPQIRGIIYCEDARRTQSPKIKYTTTYSSGTKLLYSEVNSSEYKDWTTYANDIAADITQEVDYTSYFLVGYYIHGETQRFFQGNYVFMFVDQDTLGSARMRVQYDWTTTGDSGKWGVLQQIYPDWQTMQSINYRRLKTRGKGKAMQIYVESESGKPFSILGWSVFESGNSGI